MNCQVIRITQRKYNILCIAYGGAKKKLTGFKVLLSRRVLERTKYLFRRRLWGCGPLGFMQC